ncbi:hypothetical protein [Stenotrophomonas sp. YIM B06876]|uniref:hypothetical protein n=1 Tax=Stenotrophomonas sp. YIM B06876 TaxID=3060211 RepID=UPI00273951F2|nr:hypothetical protein [Stenotrophomonas sp. YIM B06876]
MYAATLANRYPLPPVLEQPMLNSPHRRTRLNGFLLSSQDVNRFNQVLAQLGRTRPPLDPDQLATAARALDDSRDDPTPAPCIQQRLQQAQMVEQMLGDHDWEPANEVVPEARHMVGYLHESWHLIPGSLPRVGHLDDAIVVDTAWPQLVREVANFLDYRRLRQLEAQARGCRYDEIEFNRDIWLKVRRLEADLLAHRRQVRESSYAPQPAAYFRVH